MSGNKAASPLSKSDVVGLQPNAAGVSAHPEQASSALNDFAGAALGSFEYGFAQAPVTGVSQIVDHVAGTHLAKDLQFFDAPEQANLGSAKWMGNLVGGTAAMMAQFGIMHRLVGAGAAANLETSASYGLGRAALPYIGKSVATGLVWGGVFTPSSEDGNFLYNRLVNAGVTGVAFGAMTAGSIGLKTLGKAWLANDIVSNGLSGVLAGEIDVDGRSLLTTGKAASWNDRINTVTNFAVGGAFAGGLNMAHEYFRPTSGIQGVRTLADMTKLADTTVKPGHPDRWVFDENLHIPAKADLLSEDSPHWYDRATIAVRREIDRSNIPLDQKKLIVSGAQEMAYGLEAIADRPNPNPIMTIYGSARFPENDFRYQRARYTAGRAVDEGYDVMTGGGPGIMQAANQGAYEAGGNSIGVVLKLPFEDGDRGNGYQTLTLKHRNFYTRMEILKKAQVIVTEEGGIGTGAEVLDTLTHIQTNKMPQVPVYLVGSRTYNALDRWLNVMEKQGTISPKDRGLYRIVDNPDQIFEDLARRRAQQPTADASPTPPQPAAPGTTQPQG